MQRGKENCVPVLKFLQEALEKGNRSEQGVMTFRDRNGFVPIDGAPRGVSHTEPFEVPGTADLGLIQRRQEHRILIVDDLCHQILFLEFRVDGLEDGSFRNLQQLHGHGHQLFPVGGAVALIGPLLQGMPHASLGADQGVGRYSQALGQGIGGLEADAVDIESQTVGIFGNPDNRFIAIGLVNAHCPRGAKTMRLQKHHDLANDLLLGPGAGHALLALGADAFQFQQTFRGLFDDVEYRFAKGAHQFLGEVRTDTLDHAGAEVFLDAFQRGGWHDLQLGGLELQAMGAIIDPDAQAFDVLARRHRSRRSGHGDQVPLPADLDAQHTKAAGLAVEGHALDRALQAF